MSDIEYIKCIIKNCQNEHRYNHSLAVAQTCKILAKINDYDQEKAYYTGLLHDITKQASNEFHLVNINLVEETSREVKETWHAYTAIKKIVEENIEIDEEISSAIAQHVEGDTNPSLLSKILFVADYIEPNRKYESCIRARKLLLYPIDIAYASIVTIICDFLISNEFTLTKRNKLVYNHYKDMAIKV